MGLFDPPTKSIAKKVPVSAQMALTAVQTFAEISIPESVGRTKHACLSAMVMGIWVNAHALAGTFDMSQRDLTYVRNMVNNCGRIAKNEEYLVKPIVAELIEKGMMPTGFKELFEGIWGE